MGEPTQLPTPRLQFDNPSTSRVQPGLRIAGTCENRPMSGSTTLRGASSDHRAATTTTTISGAGRLTCA